MEPKLCLWCNKPLEEGMKDNAVYCNKQCGNLYRKKQERLRGYELHRNPRPTPFGDYGKKPTRKGDCLKCGEKDVVGWFCRTCKSQNKETSSYGSAYWEGKSYMRSRL